MQHIKTLIGTLELMAMEDDDSGHKECAKNIMDAAGYLGKLCAALEDANGMCRSTMMIVERGGEANWAAFEERLRESLLRQHAVMYPGQNI
jgi:predicted ATPase